MVITPAKQCDSSEEGWLTLVTSWTTLQGVNVFSLVTFVILQRTVGTDLRNLSCHINRLRLTNRKELSFS
jgi:hypothetical protein